MLETEAVQYLNIITSEVHVPAYIYILHQYAV